MNNIGNLASLFRAAIKDERTFAEAEALYSELFKDSSSFTVSDKHYPRHYLVDYLMSDVLEYSPEDWMEPRVLKIGYPREMAESLVDNFEFVELCNYKGEGEGFALLCRAEHLRTFHGKHNYS